MTVAEIKAIINGLPEPIDPALPGMEEEKAIPVLAYIYSTSEEDAGFILALERGECSGDIIALS